MYNTEFSDACSIDTFQSTNPQFEIWVDRILDEDRDVQSMHRVCQQLYSKWICCCACSYPQNVNTIVHGELYMLWGSDLCANEHTSLFFYLLEPFQSRFTMSLEASWLGTWFPYTSTEHVASFVCQLLGCCHYLLFAFC